MYEGDFVLTWHQLNSQLLDMIRLASISNQATSGIREAYAAEINTVYRVD